MRGSLRLQLRLRLLLLPLLQLLLQPQPAASAHGDGADGEVAGGADKMEGLMKTILAGNAAATEVEDEQVANSTTAAPKEQGQYCVPAAFGISKSAKKKRVWCSRTCQTCFQDHAPEEALAAIVKGTGTPEGSLLARPVIAAKLAVGETVILLALPHRLY